MSVDQKPVDEARVRLRAVAAEYLQIIANPHAIRLAKVPPESLGLDLIESVFFLRAEINAISLILIHAGVIPQERLREAPGRLVQRRCYGPRTSNWRPQRADRTARKGWCALKRLIRVLREIDMEGDDEAIITILRDDPEFFFDGAEWRVERMSKDLDPPGDVHLIATERAEEIVEMVRAGHASPKPFDFAYEGWMGGAADTLQALTPDDDE